MIQTNVENILKQNLLNPFGEKVTVVAAVKLQSVENINAAIAAGITDIGDNHVQEFRDKYDFIKGNPNRHFIGHLQTNKIKYLLGKTYLYHSVDRMNLAEELSKKSQNADITSDILLQVNIGDEQTKGGFGFDEIDRAYIKIRELPALRVRGLMAMLPFTDDTALLKELAVHMRQKYDEIKSRDKNFEYLSMGMSGDWELCVECGSNMIRLGTCLFGERHY